jgi:predicted nucleic acid-binding protein
MTIFKSLGTTDRNEVDGIDGQTRVFMQWIFLMSFIKLVKRRTVTFSTSHIRRYRVEGEINATSIYCKWL